MGRKDIFQVDFRDYGIFKHAQFKNYKEMVTWAKNYGVLLKPIGVKWAVIDGEKVQIKQYKGE